MSISIRIILSSALLCIPMVYSVACGGQAPVADQHQEAQVVQAGGGEQVKAPKSFDGKPPVGTKARCVVMGYEFIVSENTESSVYKGKTYVFCCPGCKGQFEADPEKFLKKS
jgi:YHS domain-containing protein